jgi:dTDP-4-dehydrorhamnose reductase
MSAERERVLVLGATGMLGHQLAAALADDFEVHGTVRDRPRAERHGIEAELHELEAMDRNSPRAVLDVVRPAAVVNCIGLVKQLEEASRPIPALELNALFPHRVAEATDEAGARFIQISTDCVFSGDLPAARAYTEDDRPDPVDLYGHSKLMGEVFGPSRLTLRTSMIGWELERRSGLLEWFAAQPGPRVGGFRRAVFSGLSTGAFAEILRLVLVEHRDLDGLFHVAAEPIDKHSLLEKLNWALERGLEVEPRDEPRVNRALDGSRFRTATGIASPAWDDMIAGLAVEAQG